ncbi:MAG: radical SAM family heme chaperone HemW, partial [Pseudomonadota bacterium]
SRTVDHGAWERALLAEMAAMRARSGPRRAETVFFGGGTPSLMRPHTVARLIEEVDSLWGLADGAEITLEANPTSAEAESFRGYASAGVNRLSMGVQALNDADLRALGRTHTVVEAEAAFSIARAAFPRVSFDLIYARMGQELGDWEAELARALAMAVDHLSLYQLTIEPGTRFAELHARGRLTVPDDDRAAAFYDLTQAMTEAAGMAAYEVSNHAALGAECRHNLIYWRYGDYAGVGPGAHGRLTGADGMRRATESRRDPAAWMAAVERDGHALTEEVPLTPEDQAAECVLMGLRLSEGIDLARVARLRGRPVPDERLAALEGDGLLLRGQGRLMATASGRLVLNSLIAALLD